MKLSYCTTCYNRLWQLEKTLPHNIHYLKCDEIELVIVAYNDNSVLPFLQANYADYLNDGRIRVIEYTENKIFSDGSRWSCGYVKDIAHRAGLGDVLFNLDADNFIDDELHSSLLTLSPKTMIITKQSEWLPDGRSGRIGCHKTDYGKIYYRDKGRNDDGDFMLQAHLAYIKKIQIPCLIKPVPNKKHDILKENIMNKIEIINSEGELKSFPINQSIFLKSTNKIEDSFIKTNIVLIRNIKEHGLLNNSDLYNQNIGYVKNEFDLVPLEITEEQLGDYWKITCNPVYPLAPASSYTLFIDRRLSEEYADLKKVPEKSKGPSNLILKNINLTNSKDEGIYKFKVLSEPLITPTSNIVKFQIYYNGTPLKTVIINAKSDNNVIILNGIEILVQDVAYGLGEEFDLTIRPFKSMLDKNYIVEIITANSSTVTPLEGVSPSTSISNQLILDYYKSLDEKNNNTLNFDNPNWADKEYAVEYLGDSDFILKLNNLTVDDLDLEDLSVREFAAFNRYDLTSIDKYDKNKKFDLSYEVIDDKNILFSLREAYDPK